MSQPSILLLSLTVFVGGLRLCRSSSYDTRDYSNTGSPAPACTYQALRSQRLAFGGGHRMEGVWKDLRGFVGLPVEDPETTKFADQFERLANEDQAARPAQAGGAKRRVQARTGAAGTTSTLLQRPSVAREHLPMNSLIGGGIRLAWLALALAVAVLMGSATSKGRMAVRRNLADGQLMLRRWANGADSHGWSRCSSSCGWGQQTRQLSSCTLAETRPCWGPGLVGCDGVCNSGQLFDCLGVCGGANQLDDCGVCAGQNKAKDCAGVCFGNTPTDCLGRCGGTAVVDSCGVCDGQESERDCAGCCFGGKKLDCHGVCGGTGMPDDCGVCDGANRDKGCNGLCFEKGQLDCRGVCGGRAVVDQCGVCGGRSRVDCAGLCFGHTKTDCMGVCNGTAVKDDCGVCGGLNRDKGCGGVCFSKRKPDCTGLCGGRALVDRCGVCNGKNRDVGCDGVCFSGAVETPCGCRVPNAERKDCGPCGCVPNGQQHPPPPTPYVQLAAGV